MITREWFGTGTGELVNNLRPRFARELSRRLRPTAIALAPLLIACACVCGCASTESYRYEVPFEYPSRAMSDEPRKDSIVLTPSDVQQDVSASIVAALQQREFSVVRPQVQVNKPLSESEEIETDAVPLSRQTLERYNRAVPELAIDMRARFRLRYRIRYAVTGKTLSLIIRSGIEYSGAAGDWHPYERDYSGKFFAEELRSGIIGQLQRVSRGSP